MYLMGEINGNKESFEGFGQNMRRCDLPFASHDSVFRQVFRAEGESSRIGCEASTNTCLSMLFYLLQPF